MTKVAVQDKRPAEECGVLYVRVDDGDSHDFRRCHARFEGLGAVPDSAA